tara:strand:- start:2460 stop:2810 length:351 start_codon:yes stop_codon:yes gene_type:complete
MPNKKKKRRISKEQQERNERFKKFDNDLIKKEFEGRITDPFLNHDVPRKMMVNEPKLLDSKVTIPKRLKKIRKKSKVKKAIDKVSSFFTMKYQGNNSAFPFKSATTKNYKKGYYGA